MAQFYGSMQGNRGGATRMGTKKSGFTAHIRGWRVGVSVNLIHNEATGEDTLTVCRTGGSLNPRTVEELGTFVEAQP